ncbi:hypothetical protein JTB14_023726 [Gonioctena quinquepunctata]|nr:hypothetical protein JTB14_023726 [Gonioctena quinquepunctata]
MSPYKLEVLKKEVDSMLHLGVIRPSSSPWCSPVLLVEKSDSTPRFYFDGRRLNEGTKKYEHSLPLVDHILRSGFVRIHCDAVWVMQRSPIATKMMNLDDIIVATLSPQQHLEILDEVFERLQSAYLKINIDECKFCLPSLKYLGFIVDCEGLRTDPEKVQEMLNYPVPLVSAAGIAGL